MNVSGKIRIVKRRRNIFSGFYVLRTGYYLHRLVLPDVNHTYKQMIRVRVLFYGYEFSDNDVLYIASYDLITLNLGACHCHFTAVSFRLKIFIHIIFKPVH